MEVDILQMLITGGSLQSECSARLFDAGKKLVAPLFLSMPALLLHQPANQTYPPLVSHYFTPTKIELAGQNLFWHRSFKYLAPIAGHFIWSALSAKSLHCCKSLHFGVILTLWKQWNLLRCKISIAPHHLIWSTSYTCHPGHAVCRAPKRQHIMLGSSWTECIFALCRTCWLEGRKSDSDRCWIAS